MLTWDPFAWFPHCTTTLVGIDFGKTQYKREVIGPKFKNLVSQSLIWQGQIPQSTDYSELSLKCLNHRVYSAAKLLAM